MEDIQILITSSEDDGRGTSNDEKEKKKKKTDWDLDGCEHIKAFIEARACMRRKKRKKKKKKSNSNSQFVEFQAQGQVGVDASIEEQQAGEAKAIETMEVIETEMVVVPGNTLCQEVPEPIAHEMATISTVEVPLSPTRREETKPPKGVARSPTEVSPLSEKVTSMQVNPFKIATPELNAEAEGVQTTISDLETRKPSPPIIPEALTTPIALPSSTIDLSMSTLISSSVKIASRNLLAELSSRSKTLNPPLNNETCSSDLVLGPDLLQQQRKTVAGFLVMSLEDIHHTNSFDNVERTALKLIQHTSSPLEKSSLEDLISHLAQFKANVPDAISLSEAASTQRKSLLDKTKTLDAILDKKQDELSSLEAGFSRLEEEAIEVENQIQHLLTKKEEILLQRNIVALKLEKTNQEASRALGEWRNLEKENEEVNDSWLQAKKALLQLNDTWKLFRKNLNL